jgi:hypothetical protein
MHRTGRYGWGERNEFGVFSWVRVAEDSADLEGAEAPTDDADSLRRLDISFHFTIPVKP